MHDLRQGLRGLIRNPGFTAAATLTLALGIGMNVTLFSIVNTFFLRPVPVPDPDALIQVYATDRARRLYSPPSWADYRHYRQASALEGLSASASAGRLLLERPADGAIASGAALGNEVSARLVSDTYFDVLRARFSAGRGFLPTDDMSGAPGVVVIDERLWRARLGADPSVVGRTVTLDRHPFTIVGVVSAEFHEARDRRAPELWLPFAAREILAPGSAESFRAQPVDVDGRLRPHATIAQARDELAALAAQLDRTQPLEHPRTISVEPASLTPPDERPWAMLAVWFGFTGLILLIACTNVGNLVVARVASRQSEIAVRLSLGATPSRLTRLLLVEGGLLGLLGGAAGLVLAAWTSQALATFIMGSDDTSRLVFTPDIRVVAFTLALALAAPIVFAIPAALWIGRLTVADAVKAGPGVGHPRSDSLRRQLVVAQVAASFVLLVAAALLTRTLHAALTVESGIDLGHTLAVSAGRLNATGYEGPRRAEFYRVLAAGLGGHPGVAAMSATTVVPASGSRHGMSVRIDGRKHNVFFAMVSVGYFDTVGQRILRGRAFTEDEVRRGDPVAIVTESTARRFWPEQNPLGQRYLPPGSDAGHEVVGVVADVRNPVIWEDPPDLYLPLTPQTAPEALLVRTIGDPRHFRLAAARQIRALDAQLEPRAIVLEDQEEISSDIRGVRMQAMLASGTGLLALLLAAIGLYGVVAYHVARRTRELGVRIALGARPWDVHRLVIAGGIRLLLAGVAVGALLALGLTRVLRNALFGVGPADPVSYGAALLALGAVTLLACAWPARRAAAVDPAAALRCE